MNFINFWSKPIRLTIDEGSLALELPNGVYRLIIADRLAGATAWEIVEAVVVDGSATLARGREGTPAKEWPAGSVVYNAATAGVLQSLFEQLAALSARVTSLEAGSTPSNTLTDAVGNLLTDDSGASLSTGVTI